MTAKHNTRDATETTTAPPVYETGVMYPWVATETSECPFEVGKEPMGTLWFSDGYETKETLLIGWHWSSNDPQPITAFMVTKPYVEPKPLPVIYESVVFVQPDGDICSGLYTEHGTAVILRTVDGVVSIVSQEKY